jgi:hypothetical protein
MTRIDTIIQLDGAIDHLMGVRERLIDMACTYSLDRRIDTMLRQLEDLRVDILQADLPGEKEVIFISR